MNNFIKAAIGCTAALVMTAACGKEFVNERTVEADQKTCALEYRSYETEGTVVFHDYVPKQKEADVYGGSVPYTIWTPDANSAKPIWSTYPTGSMQCGSLNGRDWRASGTGISLRRGNGRRSSDDTGTEEKDRLAEPCIPRGESR